MINVLIVDDEENICNFIEAYLKKEGYNTFIANNGHSAINIFENSNIDLVVLDRMIPDISGEEIYNHIRIKSSIPIIMLTAKTELEDKIYGFELGCDDYICKPFSPRELIVRIKAIIKRSNTNNNIIHYNNEFIINQDNRSVIVRGNEIILTNTEYKILSLMALNPEKIYTRENILESALDDFYDKFDRVVDSHIKNLRQKIEEDSKKPKIIKTIYGVGYKFGLQKNNKISLRNKIIINFSLLMAIIIIILAIFINSVFKSEFKKYIYKNIENEIKNIETQLIDSFHNNLWDIKNIELIGDKALNFGIILKVYDAKNSLIWNMVDYKQNSCHNTLNNIESNMKKMHPSWNGNFIENKSPIYKDNILIGYKSIGYYDEFYYMENDLNFLNVINTVIIIIGFISICFVILVSVVLSKRISKPIYNVSNMTKIIENGDYGKTIDYNSNIEEIYNLVSSINNLSFSLKDQEDLRRRLTTDIAHELRTPLTSIQGHLEAMIDGIWESDVKRLTIVNNEVIRLSSLVNKLRDISRFENNEDKLIKENTNLKTLIETICSSLELDAKQKNIEISYSLDTVYINIDKNKISQVLINLISNAIKYTNNNGYIYIKLYKYDSYTYISIKDNGIGIPKKDLNFIFERFYRVDKSRSKNTGGIGVGLTISKSIVKLHGGDISVKSIEGKGSEFIIKL